MKSKLLQNSKDLLSRSFNPTKCKTSLRLAGSRLKLLRNKKEVQVRQMKREIAQLLESGQDQTARIRVEHVIREEKMMSAYDLLQIYCELIVARLPIIESQKDCLLDLKEAIASVVFASPRCGDVPELLDVRKQFSAKYGKEFTTAAIELRPQCGVGRLLVEKLSATAPDGQTKIKILSAIAEEHNVKWDPKSFEDKYSGGPSSIRKESELDAEPPQFEAPDVLAHPSNNVHGSPLNFPQQDSRIPVGGDELSSSQTYGVSTKVQPEARPPGDKMSQVFQGDSHNSHLDRHRWNMEFKDASSAAQAAAESAERASMAARAAAELSIHGRILTRYPTELHNVDAYISKDEGPEAPSNLTSFEKQSEASVNISSSEGIGLQNAQIDETKPSNVMTSSRFEEGGGDSEEYGQLASLKSKVSGDDDFWYHNVPFIDEHTHKNSLKEVSEGEMNMEKPSHSYEIETANDWPEKAEHLGEGKIVKQKSVSSSCSQSSIPDDVNIFASFEDYKFENGVVEDPSMSVSETVFDGEAPQTGSHESASVFFDKSDSEDDDHVHDKIPTYNDHDSEFHLPSLGHKSPEQLSLNTDSWSPRSSSSNIVKPSPPLLFTRENSFPDFPQNTTLRDDSSGLDNFAPVTFDDSDGPTSEIDEDINASKVEESRNLLHEHNERRQSVRSEFEHETRQSARSPFENNEYSEIDSKQLSLSSDDEGMRKRDSVNIFDADSSEKFSPVELSAEHSALGSKDSQIELDDSGNESNPERAERLNFGKLTGGFRHKGHNHHLPFFKNRLDASSSSVKKEAETSATITSTTSSSLVEIGTTLEHKKGARTPDLYNDSDSDSSEEEEFLLKKSSCKQSLSAIKAVKTNSTLGASSSIFYSEDSDFDLDDSPKESLTRKSHLRSGISRRTKASPSSTRTNMRSGALDTDGMDRKPTTFYNTETLKKSGSHKRNSGKWETYEQPTSAGVASMPAKSNFWGSTEQPDSAKATPVMKQESKKWLKSEALDSDDRKEYQPLSRNTSQMGSSEQPNPVEEASKPTNSNSWRILEKPNSGKETNKRVQESKISQTSSAVEELPSPQQKSDTSTASENPKTATSNTASSYNNDDGSKKASHVHPKLPDYDALVQSLRMNRS